MKKTTVDDLIKLKKRIDKLNKSKNKIICQGNGGSAAIASHFSVDVTKNAGIRCINFNESDLITCFANDYGYENWIKQAINFYVDPGDLVILISSSGNSKNILNACKYCIDNKIEVVTFSGMKKNNKLIKLNSLGLNFHAPSKAYNLIENTHQFWLLSIIDMIIGKSEYKA
jgi:D-sedoheptulose 7-phosphate isomerase